MEAAASASVSEADAAADAEAKPRAGRRPLAAFLCGRAGLFLAVFGYAVAGALVFKALEDGPEAVAPRDVQASREDCLRELWLITERLNVLYEKNWTKLVTEQLKRFEKVVLESGSNRPDAAAEARWTVGGALLYTLTLLTTIGYSRLSPRTAAGKVAAMVYAVVGVPLMLVLLSLLGSMMADGARTAYSKIRCKERKKKQASAAVGFHKGSSSTVGEKSKSDDCTIQILPHNSQYGIAGNYKSQYALDYREEVPKRAILATVRASHARGRCRQTQVRQMLADTHFCTVPHGTAAARSVAGSLTTSDVDETEENEDSEHGTCVHDTPSRVPLIYRPASDARAEPSPPAVPEEPPAEDPVPASLAVAFLVAYVCAGALALAAARGWPFLEAAYFCAVALATIGVQGGGGGGAGGGGAESELQLVACGVYLFVGLAVVATCVSLVQEEVGCRCRRVARGLGFG